MRELKPLLSPLDRVLIVEDEPLMQQLLSHYVRDAGYEVRIAEDGESALDMLFRAPESFSAVLLDRMLPDMEGLEILKRIKQDKDLSLLPVILATAKDAESEIMEGLSAGAKHYMLKPVDQRVLVSVLDSAVGDFRRYKALQTDVRQHGNLFRLMDQSRFRFQSLLHGQTLAVALAELFPHPELAIIGLSELLTNAVEHGNLEIGYEEKSRLLEEDGLIEEIDRRLEEPEFADRFVEVEFKRSDTKISVHITDQGPGFDWSPFMKISTGRVFDRHGRGIALAGEMSFDRIEYLGNGSEVICSVDVD
ncbi:MAG: ATP-binding response regulator [bacterium]